MLFAFSGMLQMGIAGTLLSLGAIDFGIVVDSSLVVIENILRRAWPMPATTTGDLVRDAAIEVRQPTTFGQLIIMIVYLPILTLQGVEGRMFRPMAWTVILVLIGSLILSLTLMPVLASLLLPRAIDETRAVGRADRQARCTCPCSTVRCGPSSPCWRSPWRHWPGAAGHRAGTPGHRVRAATVRRRHRRRHSAAGRAPT